VLLFIDGTFFFALHAGFAAGALLYLKREKMIMFQI